MPNIDAMLAQLQNLWPALTGLFSLLAVLTLVWLKKHFVTWRSYDKRQARLDALLANHETRLAAQHNRLAVVEGDVNQVAAALGRLPQREDLQSLELGLAEVRGGLREVNAGMQGIKDLVERQEAQTGLLNEHLLSLGK